MKSIWAGYDGMYEMAVDHLSRAECLQIQSKTVTESLRRLFDDL